MREYELVFLVADNIAEDKQVAVLGKVKKLIEDAQGQIIKEENLGRRRLAYEIKKNEFATYHVVNFKVEGKELSEIERDIRLTPEVLRHIVVLRSTERVSILEEKFEATSEEEIAKAIGGERSIEQVEGETEASYDLMAKREKTGTDESELGIKSGGSGSEKPQEEIAEEKTEAIIPEAKKPRAKKITESKEISEIQKDVIPVKTGIQELETTGSQVKPGMTEEKKSDAEKKLVKKAEKKKDTKVENEADRLKKLDDKLADILGDDL